MPENNSIQKTKEFSNRLSKVVNAPVLVGVLALITIISFTIQLWPQSQKRFIYEIQSTTLIGDSQSLDDNIQVLYKENTIPNLQSTNIKITYSGKDPITKNDIAEKDPFVISFENGTEIYDIKLIEVVNPINDVSIVWEQTAPKINVDFDFFNNGDSITIQILHSGDIKPVFNLTIIGNDKESIKGGTVKDYDKSILFKNSPVWYILYAYVIGIATLLFLLVFMTLFIVDFLGDRSKGYLITLSVFMFALLSTLIFVIISTYNF